MNWNASSIRKMVYFVMMAVLLYPLNWIGAPARMTTDKDIVGGSTLATLRKENQLSELELGDIDPASETMKLATLGMRGVAASLLWGRANHYKMTKDWDNLKATLNQIKLLQPHFISVWQFQAWNLSYNVSVEFDDYRSRYHWVKKGIDYLIEGTRYNRSEPRLLWDIGWFFGQKLGRSDEHRQFRRLFREDEEYHKTLPLMIDDARSQVHGGIDNWLVGRLWFLKAQELVDNEGVSLKGKSPLLFHSNAPMALIDYATVLEEEGHFGERVRYEWQWAFREWNTYGNRQIPTSLGADIRLNDMEQIQQQVTQLRKELDGFGPDLRDTIREEKRGKLTKNQRAALDAKPELRSEEQHQLASQANQKIRVTHEEVADRVPAAQQDRARKIAKRLTDAEALVRIIDRYRNIVNFVYWKTRCQAEQTESAVNARKYVYQAGQLFNLTELLRAKQLYEKAWDEWAVVFEQFPSLMEDITASDLVQQIDFYRNLLGQLDQPFPKPFKLQALLDIHQGQPQMPDAPRDSLQEENGSTPGKPPAEDSSSTEDKQPESQQGKEGK